VRPRRHNEHRRGLVEIDEFGKRLCESIQHRLCVTARPKPIKDKFDVELSAAPVGRLKPAVAPPSSRAGSRLKHL
jgi:hypothetical protein